MRLLDLCVFCNNDATNSGGGMCDSNSNPTVTNCILWGNTAPTGPQIHGGSPTVTYSDVQGGYAGTGNIDSDPCFVGADSNDFRLLQNSPCIDAGDNISVPNDVGDLDNDGNMAEPIPYGLDGYPRIIDGDCNDTEVVDMGPYGFNYAYKGDLDYNCRMDFFDFSSLAAAWLTKLGDPGWDEYCDISSPADYHIDWHDVKVLSENWLATP